MNISRSFCGALIGLSALFTSSTFAFDSIHESTSYEDSKFFTYGAALGSTGFSSEKGLSGGLGFGFRILVGHHFNRYLETQFHYQFSTFNLTSPDPVFPSQSLTTRAAMNQETLRLIYSYPALAFQPFVSAGFGGYNLTAVNQETGLAFPLNLVVPVGVGVRWYLLRNMLSIEGQFDYEFLFGENQPADVLALLGVSKVSFNTYSTMLSVTLHAF